MGDALTDVGSVAWEECSPSHRIKVLRCTSQRKVVGDDRQERLDGQACDP